MRSEAARPERSEVVRPPMREPDVQSAPTRSTAYFEDELDATVVETSPGGEERPASSARGDDEGERKTGRRRRRRRRGGRRGDEPRTAESPTPGSRAGRGSSHANDSQRKDSDASHGEADDDVWEDRELAAEGSPASVDRVLDERDEEFEPRETGESEGSEEPLGEGERPKRRRRRRRRGRKPGEEPRRSEPHEDSDEAVAAPRGIEYGEDPVPKSDHRHAEDDEDLHAEHDDDDDDAEARHGHRAIPTWDEAIGHIVGVNMEARARNPNAGSAHRGRGRGHGGGGRGRPQGRG